jgi:serine/threonine protein kinase/dipeptidyl aminopeptidase/acylaminoacyl peptidase
MPLESGTRLGPYEILAPIGDGSDERYKASDSRRNQLVAVKILPPEFSEHPEMKARLERDARTISSLKHPLIGGVIDVAHHAPSTDFIVTEFVEGETLAVRLARGPLELSEALTIAMAMCETLDKAHRSGVIHAGLNPSVVLLTASGPKLLEFGVPKLGELAGAIDTASVTATHTSLSVLTAIPASTARYLAPEQFGGTADARSDIFAFGALLYEMVTGTKAFDEKTQTLLIAAIQTVDPPPPSTVRGGLPPALDYVIARCLNKDPQQRLQTAFDAMNELQWIARGVSQSPAAATTTGTWKQRDRTLWIAVAVASVIAVALVPSLLARFASAPEPPEVRFMASSLPAGNAPITVSPDGRWITSSINASSMIGLSLNSVTPQTLIGGVPFQPFWSPDSRSIAYFDDGKLKRADIGGGPPQIICDAPSGFSAGTWSKDGVILFPASSVIQRVLAAGGQPTPITALDPSKQETDHVGPAFLPDGRHFLFLAVSSQPGNSAVYVGSLDSNARTRLFASESVAFYAAPGYVLFNRGDTVFAQAFDANSLALEGEPIRVASNVPLRLPAGNTGATTITRSAIYAVSQTGVLAYRTSTGATPTATEEQRTIVRLDRNGQATPVSGTLGGYSGLDLSPDGKRIVTHRHDGTGGDSWVLDLGEQRLQRLTFDASRENTNPIWSPDGTRIAFGSRRNNRDGLYVKPADGSGMEELIFESDTPKVPMGWSADGKLLLFSQNSGAADAWAVPISGDKKPFALLQTPFTENFPQVSADGKWLAYQSNETGRPEIYVRPFPDGPGKWQVSTDGGQYPRWRGDGKELFFYFNNTMIAADIRVNGSSLAAGVPRTLFGLPNPSAANNHPSYHRYAVSADGQHFFLSIAAPFGRGAGGGGGGGIAATVLAAAEAGNNGPLGTTGNPVAVVLNWPQMLKEK